MVMVRIKQGIALILVSFGFFFGTWAWASDGDDLPTRITSERLRYSHHDNQIEFIGQVRVHRPGFELHSERLIVFLQTVRSLEHDASAEPDQELESRVEVEKMVAQGKVFMKHEGRIGRSDAATYWVDTEVLRLEGNAVVEEGPTKLEGNAITLNVREKELDAHGRTERRVEGMFYLPREERQ